MLRMEEHKPLLLRHSLWPESVDHGNQLLLISPSLRRTLSSMSNISMSSISTIIKEENSLTYDDSLENATFLETIFNAVNVLLGVGILSLPYALRLSGIAMGLFLFVLFSAMTRFTGILIGRMMEKNETIKSYPDIAHAAYGTFGRTILSLFFYSELTIACTMLLIIMADNLNALYPYISISQCLWMSFLAILPTIWIRDLSYLSALSIIGIISTCCLCISILYIGFDTPSDSLYGSVLHPQPVHLLGNSTAIILSLGLVMVGFAGHSVLPTIYSSMADKSQYVSMLNITYLNVSFIYVCVAVIGYLMYGDKTSKEITLNLVASSSSWCMKAMTWMIILNPATKFAIALNPIALSIEECFPYRASNGVYILFRSCLGLGICVLAIKFPDFARLTAFLGALVAMLMSVTFPICCYMKLHRDECSKLNYLFYGFLAFGSVILAILGTIGSIYFPKI